MEGSKRPKRICEACLVASSAEGIASSAPQSASHMMLKVYEEELAVAAGSSERPASFSVPRGGGGGAGGGLS